MTTLRNIGDEVMVSDRHGNYEFRGVIVGRHMIVGGDAIYDVQPNRTKDLPQRKVGIPGTQLRSLGRQILAYERKVPGTPMHILDHA